MRRLSQKTAIKLLRKEGWEQTSGGKHGVKMVKPSCRPITLPSHRGEDYSAGLTAGILKEAGIKP